MIKFRDVLAGSAVVLLGVGMMVLGGNAQAYSNIISNPWHYSGTNNSWQPPVSPYYFPVTYRDLIGSKLYEEWALPDGTVIGGFIVCIYNDNGIVTGFAVTEEGLCP